MCEYLIKHSRKNKSRKYCGGFILIVEGIKYANKYATCVSQHDVNIVISISTSLKYNSMDADVTNDYYQVLPLDEPFNVYVDDQ